MTLVACVPAPTQPVAEQPLPPPETEVYFYPNKGQSAAQQERDRYECYLWARKQTGFDPSAPGLAPHQRVRVISTAPPGRDTAAGAVTGAVIGAVVSPPGRGAEGAAVGAVAGAVIGAASEAARQEQVERVQQRYDQQQAKRMARIEQQASSYRRAMAACLEGRGYTVH
ncbi:MAG TPA: glycine zipper 2TM domain-containing protein [Acidiferrobacterales bacterium]|nr:glycine zipper 2TM domain-containing protein [Acidiferrobacterales bacterium]